MHYRNGREAKNGDRIVQLGSDGKVLGIGILYDATPGNDYCLRAVLRATAHLAHGVPHHDLRKRVARRCHCDAAMQRAIATDDLALVTGLFMAARS
jgi:hypothetical protein